MSTITITAPHPRWCKGTHSTNDPCLSESEFVDLALQPKLEMEPGVLPILDFFSLTIEGVRTDDDGLPAIELAHGGLTVAFLTVDEASQLCVALVGLVTSIRSAARQPGEGTAAGLDPERVRAAILDDQDADGNVSAQRIVSALGLADEVTR